MSIPCLTVKDAEWHKIAIAAGIEDQDNLLFIRTDTEDFGRDQITIVGLRMEEVEKIRDHLTLWLDSQAAREQTP